MDKTKSLKINIEQFSYTPSNPIFLKNKIEIGLGEIVGIVAPNGYGKKYPNGYHSWKYCFSKL